MYPRHLCLLGFEVILAQLRNALSDLKTLDLTNDLLKDFRNRTIVLEGIATDQQRYGVRTPLEFFSSGVCSRAC